MAVDVAVIGGGLIGCAAAAMLADRGLSVVLFERTAIGAGASGRNLGAVQHPFDAVLAPLYRESLERYLALADAGGDFTIARRPVGLLLVNRDAGAARRQAQRMARAHPELRPAYLDPEDLSDAEPSLAPGLAAVRLESGHPIPPGSATTAWAAQAVARNVRIRIGSPAEPVVESGRVSGVRAGRHGVAADRVLVAAGPWSPALVDPSGAWRPIHRTWGVTVQMRLGSATPRHVVEEDEVDAVNRALAATARAAARPDEMPSLFSIASAGGVSTIGSTFLPEEPDADTTATLLVERGRSFLPAIADAELVERRVCARPQSVDGRPFIGPFPDVDGLYLCAGHGPWGISTGPASAALAARAILDGTPVPVALAASRSLPG